MQPDDPRHGTYAGYVAHYKSGTPSCDPCRRAGKHMHIVKERRKIDGVRMRVQLGEDAWNILRRSPRKDIAAKLGVHPPRISTLITNGPEGRVLRTTRERIESIDPTQFVTPIGLTRRLQGLACLGWSLEYIAREYGSDRSSLFLIRSARTNHFHTRARTKGVILAAWHDLHMTQREACRATTAQVTHARNQGWVPPMAWDNIDDPSERPCGTAAHLGRGRPELNSAHIEDLEWMADTDQSLTEAANRLGLKRDTIHTICLRTNRLDLYRRLASREPNADHYRATTKGLADKRGAA